MVPPPETGSFTLYRVPFTGVPNVLLLLVAIITLSLYAFSVQFRLIWLKDTAVAEKDAVAALRGLHRLGAL